jgi:hypothetical protein
MVNMNFEGRREKREKRKERKKEKKKHYRRQTVLTSTSCIAPSRRRRCENPNTLMEGNFLLPGDAARAAKRLRVRPTRWRV